MCPKRKVEGDLQAEKKGHKTIIQIHLEKQN
jgi:hypothetical protein